MASISFNDIEDNTKIEEGWYPLVITDATLQASDKWKTLQLSYEHLGKPAFKVNYDNSIYGTPSADFDQTIPAVSFGLRKIKRLNKATGVNADNLNPDALKISFKGKKVYAHIKPNDKGYPEIVNLDIEPLPEEELAKLNQTQAQIQASTVSNDAVFEAEEDPFKM